MKTETDLISLVEDFLRQSGMGDSYFGKKAVGNSELVARLRSGRRVWPETEHRVRQFVEDQLDLMAARQNERAA